MTDLANFGVMLDNGGYTWSQTPAAHNRTCVKVALVGYRTMDFFFDADGRFVRADQKSVAATDEEIIRATCGGGP